MKNGGHSIWNSAVYPSLSHYLFSWDSLKRTLSLWLLWSDILLLLMLFQYRYMRWRLLPHTYVQQQKEEKKEREKKSTLLHLELSNVERSHKLFDGLATDGTRIVSRFDDLSTRLASHHMSTWHEAHLCVGERSICVNTPIIVGRTVDIVITPLGESQQIEQTPVAAGWGGTR